jgi:hypothetical protein
MVTGIRLTNCHNCTFEVSFGEGITNPYSITDSTEIGIPKVEANLPVGSISRHYEGRKIGRNERCPCGSFKKFKHCHGGYKMSTGIKSDNSSIKIGSANIAAEVGIDASNRSEVAVDKFNFVDAKAPDLASVFEAMGATPPADLMERSVKSAKASGAIDVLERSELRTWFDRQGINAAFWAQMVAAIAAIALN